MCLLVSCIESLLRCGPPSSAPSSRRPKPMPCALLLSPTRELAASVHTEALKLTFNTGIRSCIVFGGADMRCQRRDMELGCDILIATPGRLLDMCESGYVSLELVQFLNLDHLDRILDKGFLPQVQQIIQNHDIGMNSAFQMQSLMFTEWLPRDVQAIAEDLLEDFVLIAIGRSEEQQLDDYVQRISLAGKTGR